MEKVITNNVGEKITVKWDGERFAITQKQTNKLGTTLLSVIILNPREMADLVDFVNTIKEAQR